MGLLSEVIFFHLYYSGILVTNAYFMLLKSRQLTYEKLQLELLFFNLNFKVLQLVGVKSQAFANVEASWLFRCGSQIIFIQN